MRHDLATEQHQQPWGQCSQCQRLHFSKCHSHGSVFWHEPLASGMMASIKDATLPVMVTHHNDTRGTLLVKYSRALQGEMIFLRQIQESQRDRHLQFPQPQTHPESVSFPVVLGWVSCATSHWAPFGLFHVQRGPPAGSPSTYSQSPRRMRVCVWGSNEDFFADPRLGTDCTWEEMFSWCLLKMLFPSSSFQEGNEWGLPELHSSWNKSLN